MGSPYTQEERRAAVTNEHVEAFQLLVKSRFVDKPVVLVRPIGRAVREQDHAIRCRYTQVLQAVPALVSRVKYALPEPGATDRARRTVEESENIEGREAGVRIQTARSNRLRPLGHASAEKPMRVIHKHPFGYLVVKLAQRGFCALNPRGQDARSLQDTTVFGGTVTSPPSREVAGFESPVLVPREAQHVHEVLNVVAASEAKELFVLLRRECAARPPGCQCETRFC